MCDSLNGAKTGVSILSYWVMCECFVKFHNEVYVHSYNKLQKHFQNIMLVGMASEISKNYTYKCVDRSRHNGIKGAKAKCAH